MKARDSAGGQINNHRRNHHADKSMQTLTPILAEPSDTLALTIPIAAVVMGLAIPIVAIITEYAKRRKIYELYHKERLAAIDKGVEIPPPPPGLGSAEPRRRPRYLLRGLVWLFVGLGTLVALSGITRPEEEKVWMLGFIPTGVGLAYLIYYFAEGKKLNELAEKGLEAEKGSSQ
jgi:hypothetical protein